VALAKIDRIDVRLDFGGMVSSFNEQRDTGVTQQAVGTVRSLISNEPVAPNKTNQQLHMSTRRAWVGAMYSAHDSDKSLSVTVDIGWSQCAFDLLSFVFVRD
jgi:hypothetical protein